MCWAARARINIQTMAAWRWQGCRHPADNECRLQREKRHGRRSKGDCILCDDETEAVIQSDETAEQTKTGVCMCSFFTAVLLSDYCIVFESRLCQLSCCYLHVLYPVYFCLALMVFAWRAAQRLEISTDLAALRQLSQRTL